MPPKNPSFGQGQNEENNMSIMGKFLKSFYYSTDDEEAKERNGLIAKGMVFCNGYDPGHHKNCIHYGKWPGDIVCKCYAPSNLRFENTATERKRIPTLSPDEKNKDNRCPDYFIGYAEDWS
jgi:hypothetical protein